MSRAPGELATRREIPNDGRSRCEIDVEVVRPASSPRAPEREGHGVLTLRRPEGRFTAAQARLVRAEAARGARRRPGRRPHLVGPRPGGVGARLR